MEHINWYPGHMAKAKRQMQQDLKKIDIVIIVLDARIPYSSWNPDFDELFFAKQQITILNKADMADPAITKQWLAQKQNALGFSSTQDNKKKIVEQIQRMAKPLVEKAKAKGMNKTVRCMVVGIPNSGKSSFINRVFGGGKVKTEDRPGVTRANQWIRVSPYLELMDTPGVLWPKLEDQRAALHLCFVGSIRDQILDQLELAAQLLETLLPRYGQNIVERYGIEPEENGFQMLEAICKRRGFLFKKEDYDHERGAVTVLHEFRGGKLGRISLEVPDEG